MMQRLDAGNVLDAEGHPAGGWVGGVGIAIIWQDGPITAPPKDTPPREAVVPRNMKALPVEKPGHNGAFVEGVLDAARQRLEFYQGSKFACPENAGAIDHIKAALSLLESRTKRRTEAGTEGTHQGN